MYAIHNCQQTLQSALKLSRGCYQSAILLGHEALSGATLRGRAKNYSGRYARSAAAIMRRCRDAGLNVREQRDENGKRMVVIG